MMQSSTYFDDFEDLKKENIALKEELKNLKNKNSDYDLILKENKQFKEKEKISNDFSNYEIVVAEITSISPNNFEKVYTINKGFDDGIREKMTVITIDGLVGFISKVSKNSSNFTAIIDASTLFSARNVNTMDLFVAGGTMNLMDDNELLAKEIPFGSQFQSGDIIETSGMGNLFPKGVTIGRIKEIKADENPLEKTAIIKSSVDFNKLDIVAIIVKEK